MAGTQEIGALIVSLRTESAAFQSEMDRARKSMKGAGDTATGASRQIARFAADGLGAIIPIGNKAEIALERVIVKMLALKGAMAVAGPAAAVVGVALAALGGFALPTFLRNFREAGTIADSFGERIKIAAGFTKDFEERLKDAAAEQKTFSAEASRGRNILRDTAIEIAKLRGDEGTARRLTQLKREDAIIEAFGEKSAKRAKGLAFERERAREEDLKAQREADDALLKSIREGQEKIGALRAKVAEAGEPDEATKAILRFRDEVKKLAEEIPLRAKEILGLGAAFEGVTARARGSELAKSLGLGDANIFAGFDQIAKIKTEAEQFGRALQGLVEQGVPTATVFDLIGKAQDALSLKIANLRETFPDLADTIREQLGGLAFGGFQRAQDAVVRGMRELGQGALIVQDALGNKLVESILPAEIEMTNLGTASALLAGVLFTDVPPAAAAAAQSLVVLTANAHLLAEGLARARLEAIFLTAQVGAGGNVAVAPPGNF